MINLEEALKIENLTSNICLLTNQVTYKDRYRLTIDQIADFSGRIVEHLNELRELVGAPVELPDTPTKPGVYWYKPTPDEDFAVVASCCIQVVSVVSTGTRGPVVKFYGDEFRVADLKGRWWTCPKPKC